MSETSRKRMVQSDRYKVTEYMIIHRNELEDLKMPEFTAKVNEDLKDKLERVITKDQLLTMRQEAGWKPLRVPVKLSLREKVEALEAQIATQDAAYIMLETKYGELLESLNKLIIRVNNLIANGPNEKNHSVPFPHTQRRPMTPQIPQKHG